MAASMLSRTIGFSNAMRWSRAACSSGYSLKNASTHLVLTFLPLGSGTSSRGRLHASAIAELTRLTSCRFASTGDPAALAGRQNYRWDALGERVHRRYLSARQATREERLALEITGAAPETTYGSFTP